MPGFLHACGLYANDRPDLAAGGGDFRIAQLARPSALADPIGGQARLAVGGADVDAAAKADDVVKAQALQEREQLDVAEAAIGQDRHGQALGQELLQAGQAQVLEIVALVLQFVLVNAFAILLLTILGAAGESLGMDRQLRTSTAKRRVHSLFRQGCLLYDLIPNMPEERLRPLVERYEELLRQNRSFSQAFGIA